MSKNILIVDDELSNRRILEQVLSRAGYSVETADGGSRALEQLDALRPDVIILDYMMPDLTGMDVLRELRKREDDTPVIMITAYGTIERAVEAIQEGAYDFITRPFKPDHITHVVRKALERQKLKRGVEVLSQEVGERYRLIIGESAKMKQAVELARRTAASSATFYSLVKAGREKKSSPDRSTTGARERTDRSSRSIPSGFPRNSWKASCSATNREHSPALCGVRRARSKWRRAGLFFLTRSAISRRSSRQSFSLLLQEREFERVGGTTPISVDVRVIAATIVV